MHKELLDGGWISVRVENSLGLDLRFNGKYYPLLPSVVFNFRILDVGPVCRVCVDGSMHNGSRTHKHSLQSEEVFLRKRM
jgi:hypothetical protein